MKSKSEGGALFRHSVGMTLADGMSEKTWILRNDDFESIQTNIGNKEVFLFHIWCENDIRTKNKNGLIRKWSYSYVDSNEENGIPKDN